MQSPAFHHNNILYYITSNKHSFTILFLLDVLWYVLATNGGHSWLLVILFAIPPRDAHYLCGVGAYDLSLHYHIDERKKSSGSLPC